MILTSGLTYILPFGHHLSLPWAFSCRFLQLQLPAVRSISLLIPSRTERSEFMAGEFSYDYLCSNHADYSCLCNSTVPVNLSLSHLCSAIRPDSLPNLFQERLASLFGWMNFPVITFQLNLRPFCNATFYRRSVGFFVQLRTIPLSHRFRATFYGLPDISNVEHIQTLYKLFIPFLSTRYKPNLSTFCWF